MKYRAIAIGVLNVGHPVQSYNQHLRGIQEWARIVSDAYGCKVNIYAIEERLMQIIYPPEPAEKKVA